MRSLWQCRVIALLLATAVVLAACGGGATSSGIGTPGGGGGGQNINPNLQGLTLACTDPNLACAGIRLIPPAGVAPPAEDGFIAGAVDRSTNALLGDYSSTQSALVESVTVTPTTFANGATVTVNDLPVTSGSASPAITLSDGENIINIVVTSPNGQNTRTYRIILDRISRDNAELAALSLTAGTLDPAFARDEFAYETTVPFNVGTAACRCVRVNLRLVEPAATVEVIGHTLGTVEAGLQSTQIPLAVGEDNLIVIRVESLSGNVKNYYRINITRFGSAELSSITVTGYDGPDDSALSLETPFVPATPAYIVLAENRIDAVSLSAVATEAGSGATVIYTQVPADEEAEPVVIDEDEITSLKPFDPEDPDSAINLFRIQVDHPFGPEGEPETQTYTVTVRRQRPPLYEAEAYLKPGVAGAGFRFGYSIALAEPEGGLPVLAVGSPGANGNRGAVFVYELDNEVWVLRDTVDGVEPDPCNLEGVLCDPFGYSVALSADGKVLAVGAPSESTAEPRQIELQVIEVTEHGAVYLYTRNDVDGTWSGPLPVGPFETGINYRYGHSVALAQAGPGGPYTLAVGVPGDSGDRDGGVHPDPTPLEGFPEGDEERGAVLIFGCEIIAASLECSEPQALIRPPDAQVSNTPDEFGGSLALSADGNVLAVGAPGTGGGAGTGGDRGVVYIHVRDAGVWGEARQAVRTMTPRSGDVFGRSLSLSAAGDRLAVGMPGQLSPTSGVGASVDLLPTATGSGSVIVFNFEEEEETDPVWVQQVFIKPSNTRAGFSFGESVALSADGRSLTVGAPGETSLATTVDGNPRIDGAGNSGAIYQFRSILEPVAGSLPSWCQDLVNVPQGQPWCQTAFIKTPNSRAQNRFGAVVALSGDGRRVIGGAPGERSASTGDPEFSGVIMGADYPVDNTAANRGAAFLFRTDEPFEDPEPPPEEPPPEEPPPEEDPPPEEG